MTRYGLIRGLPNCTRACPTPRISGHGRTSRLRQRHPSSIWASGPAGSPCRCT